MNYVLAIVVKKIKSVAKYFNNKRIKANATGMRKLCNEIACRVYWTSQSNVLVRKVTHSLKRFITLVNES